MTRKVLFIFCLLIGLQLHTSAQDIHFSSYEFSPLTVNPALAGSFNGSYRVGGIYRDQWRSVSGSGAYMTGTIHVDLPVIKGFRKQDWIGMGAMVFVDRSSQYAFQQTKSLQGISYHLSLDKKQTQIISFGIQNGTGQRRLVNPENLFTEGAILGLNFENPDQNLFDAPGNTTIIDWVGGVTYSSYQRNLSFIRAGFSIGRIPRSNQAIAKGSDRQKIKYTAFALYDTPIAGNLFLTPSVFYQRTGNNQELVLQTKASYLLSEERELYGNFGLGYRVGDAIQFLIGADIKDVKVQLAYDLNASGLVAASRSVGAFEIAVSYIGKVYKKPKVDPTKVCPRL